MKNDYYCCPRGNMLGNIMEQLPVVFLENWTCKQFTALAIFFIDRCVLIKIAGILRM